MCFYGPPRFFFQRWHTRELGDISDVLLASNQADMALFCHADNRLDERVNDTEGFGAKLQDFRHRCSLLGR